MTGWTRQRICSYSIQSFLLIKHYTCLRVWVSKTFFLTWHCNRRIISPAIKLGNETHFSPFRLSFDFLGTESDECLSFFLSLGRGKREERKGGGAWRSQSYRVKHKEKMDKRVHERKTWRQRAPPLLPSSPPPSASSRSEGKSLSVFTCTVVIKAILRLLKLSYEIQLF